MKQQFVNKKEIDKKITNAKTKKYNKYIISIIIIIILLIIFI